MKKILVVDDESGIDLTVNLNDVRDVYRHVCDILIQRVSMDSPHDLILINIKDQLKDYIDKCLPGAGGMISHSAWKSIFISIVKQGLMDKS